MLCDVMHWPDLFLLSPWLLHARAPRTNTSTNYFLWAMSSYLILLPHNLGKFCSLSRCHGDVNDKHIWYFEMNLSTLNDDVLCFPTFLQVSSFYQWEVPGRVSSTLKICQCFFKSFASGFMKAQQAPSVSLHKLNCDRSSLVSSLMFMCLCASECYFANLLFTLVNYEFVYVH